MYVYAGNMKLYFAWHLATFLIIVPFYNYSRIELFPCKPVKREPHGKIVVKCVRVFKTEIALEI